MMKTDLPVIVLRGIILLPNNDIRLEFDSEISKNIIDVSELFHDNKVLIVTKENPLEENLEIKKLPRIGVVAKLSHKMELPNGKTRVIITGIKRAYIHEYLSINKRDDILEAIISDVKEEKIESKQEVILIKKLYRELENYTKIIPYVSNSILSTVSNCESLSKMTDIIVPYLQTSNEQMIEYLNIIDPIERLKLILADLYKEEEMFEIEKELDNKVKKNIDETQREYILREKIKTIKQELKETTIKDDEIEILREKINKIEKPKNIKMRLNLELKRYQNLSEISPEVSVVRNYIDWLLDIPWNKYSTDNNNLKDVKKRLDESHDGLEKVKQRIIEYLAVKQRSENLKSPIICLIGPPGVGKTSLAFSIAKALNRNFTKISVGGINDEAEIIGHRRTYLGSNPGRIIQSIKKANSMNPVFLIDEIDKMTKDYKGDPSSVLLEVLDPEQNRFFSDNYIEEEVDLSKIMFITTANYIEDIPEPLQDRLEIIEISGYTEYEKLNIAKKHLIPKICKEHNIKTSYLFIEDEIILKIIRNFTKESGVRELERQISKIIRKIVTNIIINKVEDNKYIIDENKILEYLGNEKYNFNKITNNQSGIVNGLAYTYFGGDTLKIEVTYFKGNGNLELTGSLGEVMKESAKIAFNYIKANHKLFKIDYDKLINNDIHIHVPEGAIKKDGPSAGITITTALISSLTDKKIDNKLAMTGEISLRGEVLPIGGLKEKSIGALRSGIDTIIIPEANKKDLDEIPKEVKEKINYILVNNYKEIYDYIEK